ncbi:MAG: WD40/YVTN/BNR-like repeat-containing protein, partial [Bryobacteraceae bacterium]
MTLLLLPALGAAHQVDPSLFSGMHWRMIGPFRGGRSDAATGVPGEPNHFYFGSVGGGVWETFNSGDTWTPIFDGQKVQSIGAIAVAPSDTKVIYVGTGEADMRSQISYGDGMYKSTDGGRTWKNIGLGDTRQIGRILVDPRNPDIVFVAALGHAYGPNAERGVFRSSDGGATWQKVLYKDENTGAIDLAFDPRDSQIVYASLWATRRPPWTIYPPSNAPGGGLYKSTDGGSTWHELTGGLPNEGVGRIGVAVAPGDSNRVYAIVDAKNGGLFRSDDAGASWKMTNDDQRIWGRGWYFCNVVVDPKDADKVYISNTSVYRSDDGGKTVKAIKGAPGGDDYHQLWIYPGDGDRMILASDQCTEVSVDGGKSWSSWYNQPTAQIYHLVTDNQDPYWVYGAQQDSGSVKAVSRSIYGTITYLRDWAPICA